MKAVNKASIQDIDKLEMWYMNQQPHAYFKVYHGHTKLGSPSTSNIEETDKEKAWEAIKVHLEIHDVPGGAFTINTFPDPNKANSQLHRAYFMWPVSQTAPNINGAVQAYGINEAQVQSRVNDAVEKAMMRRDLEDLQMQINNPTSSSFQEFMMNLCQEHAPQILGMFGALLAPPQAHGVYGPADPTPPEEINIDDMTAEEIAEDFKASIETIQSHFGDDTAAIFNKLAAFIDKDPAKARNLINTFLV